MIITKHLTVTDRYVSLSLWRLRLNLFHFSDRKEDVFYPAREFGAWGRDLRRATVGTDDLGITFSRVWTAFARSFGVHLYAGLFAIRLWFRVR